MKTSEVKEALGRVRVKDCVPISFIDSALEDADTYAQNLKTLLSHLGETAVTDLEASESAQDPVDPETEEGISFPDKADPAAQASWSINNCLPKMTREDEVRYAKRLEFFKSRMVYHIKVKKPGKGIKRFFSEKKHCCRNNKVNNLRPICKVVGECPEGKLGFIQECCSSYQWVRARYVERNLFLAIHVARQYGTYSIPVMDLVQEGSTSLIRAVEKYDWRRGVRFQTYAVFWIRQAVERLITANRGMVRVPNYLQQKMRRLKRNGDLSKDTSALSIHEVAELFNLPSDVAGHLLETSRTHVSLDSVSSQENECSMKTTLSLYEDTSLSEEDYHKLQSLVIEAFSELTKQERFILQNRFGLDGKEAKTLEEIGGILGVSRERIRQIQIRALSKLRKPMIADKLNTFLP
ncbi:MAG: sigma-70 family RNA polymerase sigma factor [Planctomycetota bacterium]